MTHPVHAGAILVNVEGIYLRDFGPKLVSNKHRALENLPPLMPSRAFSKVFLSGKAFLYVMATLEKSLLPSISRIKYVLKS
jgi:hypothetical protein